MISKINTLYRSVKREITSNVADDSVFFLHVPKCGGSSVEKGIQEAFGLRSGIQFSRQGLVARPECIHLSAHASKKAADALGVDLQAHREQVLLYFMSQSPPPLLIGGHFKFSKTAYNEYGEDFFFVTMIRDPVERWISQYLYNRYKDGSHFSIEKGMEEYINTNRSKESGKMLINYFAGFQSEYRASDSDKLNEAKKTIGKFDVVGFLDNIDRFEESFEQRVGASIDVPRRNENPVDDNERKNIIDDDVMRKIKDICNKDIEFYEYARERYL